MKKQTPYNHESKIYKPSEIREVLKLAVSENDLKGNNKKIYYYNLPCSFDIETTSFYRDLDGTIYNYSQRQKLPKDAKIEKLSIMYIWQFGINGFIMIGRTWKEFLEMLEIVSRELNLNENKRLLIYVHNLSFEFQYIRKLFNWSKVFSLEIRKPLYAITGGFEFRCSYLLSGYNLATVAKNLTKYKIKKLAGDLDYHLLRHSKTELTETELQYCINDVKIVMLYLLEYIEKVKTVHNIPLTKTGGVRKFCRKNCFSVDTPEYKGVNYRYKDTIKELQISDLHEFNAINRAFSGGFTHANAYYTDEIINNVSSFDFTSSYPFVMIAEMYPMSKGVKIMCKSLEHFELLINKYLCVFDVEFINIFSRETHENYLSVSKCFIKENPVENNGRLVCAGRIVTTLTNIDFSIVKNFYTWEQMKIGFVYCYRKEYLPTEFVQSIIELYKMKTELKGVEGMETEYLASKEMLNSCYGMSVTNPLRDEILYTEDWEERELTESEKATQLINHNSSRNRFLYYIWGVFVTAYARRNLFTAISELKDDYIYSDTDSVKFINYEKHKAYFEIYNKIVETKLKNACQYHGINFDDCQPKTKNGDTKLIGVWDYEGTYTRFKTLGAKRYLVEKENVLTVDGKKYDFSLTVSGVNKFVAIPYLLEKYGKDGIFDAFTNYLHLPPSATGKNILTYIDYETSGKIKDYKGIENEFNEKSAIHLESTDYHLSLSIIYLRYLQGIKYTN